MFSTDLRFIDYIICRVISGDSLVVTVSANPQRIDSTENTYRFIFFVTYFEISYAFIGFSLVVTGSGFGEGPFGDIVDQDEFNHLNFQGDYLFG
jgi:hypothetical protein